MGEPAGEPLVRGSMPDDGSTKLVAVSLLALVALGGVDLEDRRPGRRLSGEVIAGPLSSRARLDLVRPQG
jgi:hypothetical protein